MEKNKKNEIEKAKETGITVRTFNDFPIELPDTSELEECEKKPIRDATKKGFTAIGKETYINSKQLAPILNTDKKGAIMVMNDAPGDDIKACGDAEYLSTPHVQKEIAKRRQQPRSMLEQEKLAYSGKCVDAAANNPVLKKERAIESDRIAIERPKLGKKTIKERGAKYSEVSGEPLEDKSAVHHKDRVADKPEKALETENLVVMTEEEHVEFHKSKYLPNPAGFEEYVAEIKKKKLKEK